jgi:ABC-2 type transport system permease protein
MASEGLKPTDGSGWLSGFRNMLRKENGSWWNTRRWLVQSAIWLLLLNGIVSLPLMFDADIKAGVEGLPMVPVQLFVTIMGAMTPFGVMVLTQSDIVGEKQSGTAEWVLSAPLSREAFVLSKLAVNYGWILAVLALLQGLGFEVVLMAFGKQPIPALNLLGSLAIQGLHLLFWLTLSLMLGAFFKGRGPVLGIPIGIMVLQDLVAGFGGMYYPWIPLILPRMLPELALQATLGQQLSTVVPLATITAWSMLFMVAAVWRFKREEF